MTEFYAFAGAHPSLTFFLGLVACCSIVLIISLPFKLVNRYVRHLNIKHAGWPPEHLDADGDFRPQPLNEEDDE